MFILSVTDEKGTLSKAVAANPSCVPTLTISGGAFFAVFGMFIYHSYLVSFYLTTSEEIKGYWSPISSNRVSKSPFTHGNFILNFLAIICAPRYPRCDVSCWQKKGSFYPESQLRNLILPFLTRKQLSKTIFWRSSIAFLFGLKIIASFIRRVQKVTFKCKWRQIIIFVEKFFEKRIFNSAVGVFLFLKLPMRYRLGVVQPDRWRFAYFICGVGLRWGNQGTVSESLCRPYFFTFFLSFFTRLHIYTFLFVIAKKGIFQEVSGFFR